MKNKCTTDQWVNWIGVLQIQILHASVLGGNWNILLLNCTITASSFLDYTIPLSSHLLASIISMDIHNSLWLFYPTSKVFPSSKISCIKWRLCGPVDHWSGVRIWLLMLLLMTIIKLGLLCRLQNHQDHLSTKGLKCCWMSLKRRNKNITKKWSHSSSFLGFSCYVFSFSTLCIVIKIEHAMFNKNFISIIFIN